MIFACYKLNDNKLMSDGTEIPSGISLYCVKNEDDILFLLFEDEKQNEILFWARLEEVSYIGDFEKKFDINFNDIINGDYFNLI